MLIWNAYFLVKCLLWSQDKLEFIPLWNVALLLLALVTWVGSKGRPSLRLGLQVFLILPLAVALLLEELGIVVTVALFQQIQNLLSFSDEYLLELLERTFPPELLGYLLVFIASLHVLNRYFRLGAWVAAVVVVTGVLSWQETQAELEAERLARLEPVKAENNVRDGAFSAEKVALGTSDYLKLREMIEERQANQNGGNLDTPDGFLDLFYQDQKRLTLDQLNPLVKPDFDIIFLHLCSLAWSDLRYAKQSQHPVIANADLLLEDFNTVASYSGPATIRLLRSSCGQKEHKGLYTAADPQCALFHQLAEAGFSIQLGLNHDGKFDNFKKDILTNLTVRAAEPVLYNEVSLGGIAFDGSEIGRDIEFLTKWWDRRQTLGNGPVALYYNSITLHDGNKLPNVDMSSIDSYPLRLERLLNDIQRFLAYIKQSDRHALVVILPEHGAGMTGEYGQMAGLRELPTPAITKAPVLAYWLAPDYVRRDVYDFPIKIEKPSSYFTFNEFLSRWINLPPDQRMNPNWPILISDLSATPFVAQQGEITVVRKDEKYLLKTPGNPWTELKKPKE